MWHWKDPLLKNQTVNQITAVRQKYATSTVLFFFCNHEHLTLLCSNFQIVTTQSSITAEI